MPTKNLSCPVEAEEAFGVYANAFRIMPGGGTDIFLDFCLYSEDEDRARVVSRVRVGPDFLRVITDRIKADTNGTDPMKEGHIFLMPGLVGEN